MIDGRTSAEVERMREAVADVLQFTLGMTEAKFRDDRKTQAAVMMCLVRMGEAAARITAHDPDFAAANSHLPWDEMRALRNRTAHGYHTIDYRVVWVVVKDSLPALSEGLKSLTPSNYDS